MKRSIFCSMVLSVILLMSLLAGCSASTKDTVNEKRLESFKKSNEGVQVTCLLYADENKVIKFETKK